MLRTKNIRYLVVFIFLTQLIACKIIETFKFDEKMGGAYSLVIDISKLAFMQGSDSEELKKMQLQADSLNQAIKSRVVEGITKSSFVFDEKKNQMKLGMEFNSLAALNNYFNSQGNPTNSPDVVANGQIDLAGVFFNQGSKYYYQNNEFICEYLVKKDTTSKPSSDEENELSEISKDTTEEKIKDKKGQEAVLASMIEMQTNFRFKKLPKAVEFENYEASFEIDDERNLVILYHNIAQLMGADSTMFRKVIIKF